MGKQHEKKLAAAPDALFVFGIDDAGKPRGARFTEFNEKIRNVAAEMMLSSVYPASAAFTDVAMKLPAGRLYASGKAFIPSIRRDLLQKLTSVLASPGDESKTCTPAGTPAEGTDQKRHSEQAANSAISAGLPRS
jgi:hypothetical protein